MKIPNDCGLGTRAIHAGQEPEPITGAIMPPIFQTSTYVQDGPGGHSGFEYSRTGNPTRKVLEDNLADLEGAKYGLCFGSGCAATNAILMCLSSGDHVLANDDLYGGTFRLFDKVFKRLGIDFTFVDMSNLDETEKAFRANTKLLWLETPTNPMLKLADIEAITAMASPKNVPVVLDNTFATPILQQPLSLGATIVLHSTTKYLGGHSDVIGGAVVTNDAEWNERIAFIQNSAGGVPGPFDCFLTLRGVKTLQVRMNRHVENAERLASFLHDHPNVEHVYYPGLENHPHFDLAKRQMKGPGGMISFVIKGGLESAEKLLRKTKIFACAESLGGVESLIEHPAIMTHASVPADIRATLGIDDGLIRISVGIEDYDDLQRDIAQALEN